MCISVGTPSMSGVSLTVDHDAAMWCNQVPHVTSSLLRALHACVRVTLGCSWCFACARSCFIPCTLQPVSDVAGGATRDCILCAYVHVICRNANVSICSFFKRFQDFLQLKTTAQA